ncbi:hypothetical protein TNCV_3672162 [Trichonephila clavipes]|nr:hypothetical protein TNCV_3672162 [Trichonephila clavipes]
MRAMKGNTVQLSKCLDLNVTSFLQKVALPEDCDARYYQFGTQTMHPWKFLRKYVSTIHEVVSIQREFTIGTRRCINASLGSFVVVFVGIYQ